MSKTFLGFGKGSNSLHMLNRDEALTADIDDDDYDAHNDETFGSALEGDDWEETHEKYAELEDKVRLPLVPTALQGGEADYVLPHDIVERSISHLVLEDDHEEDPAIMTYSKAAPSPWPSEWGRPSTSPPPPAILEQQFGNSPGKNNIWSPRAVPPPDDKLADLLKALQQQSVAKQSMPEKSLPANVKTLEELERDILSPSDRAGATINHRPLNIWNDRLPAVRAEHLEREAQEKLQPFSVASIERELLKQCSASPHRNSVPIPIRQDRKRWPSVGSPPDNMGSFALGLGSPISMTPSGLQSSSSPNISPGGPAQHRGRVPPPSMPPGFGARVGAPPPPLPNHIMMGRGRMTPNSAFNPSVLSNMPRSANMPLQRPPPCFRPGITPNSVDLRRFLYPRQIQHPLLNKNQVRMPLPNHLHQHHQPYYHQQHHHQQHMPEQPHWRTDHDHPYVPGPDDVYAGLMTQKEKDWLIRIQLLQLQTDNPEVDDYYFTMFTKKAAEDKEEGFGLDGDGDKLKFLCPERVRTESKSYTPKRTRNQPMQFERSLGKLQVVSVNYPRKILDMGVQRLNEDEERTVPPDTELLWFRHLLLDIEKLYSAVLDYESESCPKENKAKLEEKLFTDLHGPDDRFMQIASVRKGRTLILRVLPILKQEHKVTVLSTLLRHLTWVQRKDRHDHVLLYGHRAVKKCIQECSFDELIELAAALKTNSVQTLACVFAICMVCLIMERAEELYKMEPVVNEDVRDKWSNLASELVERWASGLTPDATSTVVRSQNTSAVLSHLHRLRVDRTTIDKLSPIICKETTQQNGFSDLLPTG
ncbi:protein PAT1 homolog 1-like isoform X3 [Ornithodoros turicata]|uniref:protein PAT1 homolog 1-like isoform X3 n=1 Tax=Ornithodoros turicata TaxID=34597 RepID=UPI0031395A65